MSQSTELQRKLSLPHNPGPSLLLVHDPSVSTKQQPPLKKTLLSAPPPPPPPALTSSSQQQYTTATAVNYALNAHIEAGQKASRLNDLKALYITYADIGVALGIKKECTDLIRRFLMFKPTLNNGNGDLMFKKDRQNLEGMLAADTELEEKVKHVQQFMRRRRIPQRVINTLHVPKTIISEENNYSSCRIVREASKISAREKCEEKSVGCQTVMDEVMRYDVGCQTVEKTVADYLLRHDVGSQTVENSTKQDVSCQTAELFNGNEEYEDLNSGNKRKRTDEQDETCFMERSTTSCCCNRVNCTDDDKLRESSSGSGVTKLLLMNLHPKVTEDDISVMFKFNFKSYRSTSINYYSTGVPLGTADIIFGEKADALRAKKKFNGKKLDGQPMDIVLLDQKVYDFIENGHSCDGIS